MNNFSCDYCHLIEFFILYDASKPNLQLKRADDENRSNNLSD